MMSMTAIRFRENRLFYLDQRHLPYRELWRECRSLSDGARAIRELRVRGAPLIGVFAGYCICVHLKALPQSKDAFYTKLKKALKFLGATRPTAVNLSWALSRIQAAAARFRQYPLSVVKKAIVREANLIHAEDIALCQMMAKQGVRLINAGEGILTHCNTGFLATSGQGTALAVIYKAHALGKKISVYADETRPLLQGARLTAWELSKKKIPATLICDNAAASLMRQGKIDKVLVGADRIAANGDVANKIGTYGLAVLARQHHIPFYVVAPESTFDLSIASGKAIPIEKRPEDEVLTVLKKVRLAPRGVRAFNEAFDITPAQFITAIVSDKGIIYPPFKKNIKRMIKEIGIGVEGLGRGKSPQPLTPNP